MRVFGRKHGENLETLDCIGSRRLCRRRVACSGQRRDISGAGATFPYPIYAKWADAYKKETGNG